MKQTTKISRAAGYLETIYNLANEEFFENALSRPMITIQNTPDAYGHITVGKVWKIENKDKTRTYELNIGAGTLNRPIEETVATLIHEMVHQYHLDKGIQDVSRGGSYHNKRFKLEFCLDHELTEIKIARESYNFRGIGKPGTAGTPDEETPTKPKTSTRKYICPKCGNSIRATKDVNIMCMDCNEMMRKA